MLRIRRSLQPVGESGVNGSSSAGKCSPGGRPKGGHRPRSSSKAVSGRTGSCAWIQKTGQATSQKLGMNSCWGMTAPSDNWSEVRRIQVGRIAFRCEWRPREQRGRNGQSVRRSARAVRCGVRRPARRTSVRFVLSACRHRSDSGCVRLQRCSRVVGFALDSSAGLKRACKYAEHVGSSWGTGSSALEQTRAGMRAKGPSSVNRWRVSEQQFQSRSERRQLSAHTGGMERMKVRQGSRPEEGTSAGSCAAARGEIRVSPSRSEHGGSGTSVDRIPPAAW